MSGKLLGEWAAFERVEGPLLVHERIDMLFTVLAGKLPPWYEHVDSTIDPADDMAARLTSMAQKPIKQRRKVK